MGPRSDGHSAEILAARSCWFHWVGAKFRTLADAIAFMLTDLIIVTFNFTCHERVFLIPMR